MHNSADSSPQQGLCVAAIQHSLLPLYKNLTHNNIHIFNELDSTNMEAKRYIERPNTDFHGAVFLAEKQTAGRGRLGRSFFSPPQSGLYMSVLYRIDHLDPMLVTALSALATVRAIQEVYEIETFIKWVNDIYLDEKKVCGILTEGIINQQKKSIDTVIIGIGINVYTNPNSFPQDLHNAGSLSQTKQVLHDKDFYKTSRNLLCASLLNALFSILASNPQTIDSCIEEYKKRSFLPGKIVTVVKGNEIFKAKVIEITKQAHLLIEKEDGNREELCTGEVSIRL